MVSGFYLCMIYIYIYIYDTCDRYGAAICFHPLGCLLFSRVSSICWPFSHLDRAWDWCPNGPHHPTLGDISSPTDMAVFWCETNPQPLISSEFTTAHQLLWRRFPRPMTLWRLHSHVRFLNRNLSWIFPETDPKKRGSPWKCFGVLHKSHNCVQILVKQGTTSILVLTWLHTV